MVALGKVWNVFVSMCVVVAFLLVGAFTVPRFVGLDTFVVTSGSMEPEYPVGSLIFVSDVSPDEIQIGDAITFHMADSQIVATHQVYEIDRQEGLFRTQGINNRDTDGSILHDAEPVFFDSLIGKPIVCIPYLGYVNHFCTTPPGIYILLIGAVIIALLSSVVARNQQQHSSTTNKETKEKM